jgi:hypothetical protein
MGDVSDRQQTSRPLTAEEAELIRWMLENGEPEGKLLLPHLEKARATSWRCPCGCASINLSIEEFSESSGNLRIVSDFIFGNDADLSGIFVFERNGVLAGLEVYGLAGDAPKSLPSPDSLRDFPRTE